MAKKVSDVVALLHPKAVKVSPEQVYSILNYEVLEDIRAGLWNTWPDEFIPYIEITIDTDTATDYSLPSNFRRYLQVLDQSGNDVEIRRTNSLDVDKNIVLFTFDTNGLPIVRVNASTSITKLIIRYEKSIDVITTTEQNLPFPDHISKQILPILAKGVSYYYLRSRKKTTEVSFISVEYEDLKSSIFEGNVISF